MRLLMPGPARIQREVSVCQWKIRVVIAAKNTDKWRLRVEKEAEDFEETWRCEDELRS